MVFNINNTFRISRLLQKRIHTQMYTKTTQSKGRTPIQRIPIQQLTVHIKINHLGSKENGQNAIFLDNHKKKKTIFFSFPTCSHWPSKKNQTPSKKNKKNKWKLWIKVKTDQAATLVVQVEIRIERTGKRVPWIWKLRERERERA